MSTHKFDLERIIDKLEDCSWILTDTLVQVEEGKEHLPEDVYESIQQLNKAYDKAHSLLLGLKDYPEANYLDDLSKEKQEEFESLAENYSNALQMMDLFIENNGMDYDDIWDKANQKHDDDMSYAPDED